ncbi:protease modulator HflC [Nitrosococcus oceani]|uniref:Protein HflC n=2 Tax=Nitrosococcus oceani TaxID=1229 RepID=Q3J806_NITOC|nr:protease modulator HflC [Nitrosococcus oceani]KFI18563.1 membane protease HflC [Nitrosococcus oceani C-27]ABA59040.1 protease FtsH subunit HflC [Nitrosococcus oceani ATCC 19707]EDZ65314.1 HflC protein [Nitrosococcus oceani AFC27]KFI21791.1 membane protease HflC [Nitrosococcus oceani]GEM21197.1 protease modulator HflC [Nitrosococcus oceani]
MMSKSFSILAGLLALLLVIGSQSVFTVSERERALLLWLGKIERSDFEPGLHFKVPFFNSVRKFDGRILTLDAETERYLTVEKKNVLVDSFMMWRIGDVAQYYRSMGGDESRAALRLSQIIRADLRSEFGRRTVQEVISGERSLIMEQMQRRANKEAEAFGITIADVRIKRVDLPKDVSSSVYARMEAERERVAKELRSQGAETAERIRSEADRQRTIILANAQKEAENIRGAGDAIATDIYAETFDQDPEFYALYRSLAAYQKVFSQESLLLLEPKGEFFRFFNPKLGLEEAESNSGLATPEPE